MTYDKTWVELSQLNQKLGNYLKTDGSSALTGDWDAGDYEIRTNDLVVDSTASVNLLNIGDATLSEDAGTLFIDTNLDVTGHLAVGSDSEIDAGFAPTVQVLANFEEDFGTEVTLIGWGVRSSVSTIASDEFAGTGAGVFTTSMAGGALHGELYGIDAYAGVDTGSTVTTVFGVRGGAGFSGDNATISEIIGGDFKVNSGFSMIGVTLTEAIAGKFQLLPFGSGEVDIVDGYGILIKSPGFVTTGVKTNLSGIKIEDQSAAGFATDYNLLSEGVSSQNKFEGDLYVDGTLTLAGVPINEISNDSATDSTSALLTAEAIHELNLAGTSGSSGTSGNSGSSGSSGSSGNSGTSGSSGTSGNSGTSGSSGSSGNSGTSGSSGSSGTSSVTAAGTDHSIARYDGATTIQDSGVILDDSDNISGVNDLSILGDLTVGGVSDPYIKHDFGVGTNNVVGGVNAGANLEAGSDNNVLMGYQAGQLLTTGDRSVIIGSEAGAALETGIINTIIGYRAGKTLTGSRLVAIGYLAAELSTGSSNTAVGAQALQNHLGGDNVAVGSAAMISVAGSGDKNTAVGSGAARNITTASWGVYIGFEAGKNVTTGAKNIAIGVDALNGRTGQQNVAVGYRAMNQAGADCDDNVCIGNSAAHGSGSNNFNNCVYIGSQAGQNVTTGSNNSVIGYQASYFNNTGQRNAVMGYKAGYGSFGNNWSDTVLIGYQAGTALTTGSANVLMGSQAALSLTTGASSVIIGADAGKLATTGTGTTLIGAGAGQNITSAQYNTAVGYHALWYSNGWRNTILGFNAGEGTSANNFGDSVCIGYQTGLAKTSGGTDVLIGSGTGIALTTGGSNVLVGYQSGKALTTGSSNVLIGKYTGEELTTQTGNTFIGHEAGKNVDGNSYSVCIGYQAGMGAEAGTGTLGNYQIFIGSLAGNSYITGSARNIAIGQSSQYSLTSGTDNVSLGIQSAMRNQTGVRNVSIGTNAGYGAFGKSGNQNGVYIGYYAAQVLAEDSGSIPTENIVIGQSAAYKLAGSGSTSPFYNVIIGSSAGYNLVASSNNVIIGHRAGYSSTSSGSNVFIGYRSGYNESGNNKLYIENSDSASPLIYGEFDNDIVTINGDLNVTGTLNVASGSAPASAGATGTTGDIAWDTTYMYICIATDTWKRVLIETW